MIYLVVGISTVLFIELFIALKLIGDSKSILKLSAATFETLKSKSMSDEEKEAFMQKNSISMLTSTLKVLVKFILIFALIFLVNWIFLYLYPLYSDQLIDAYTSVISMVLITLAAVVYVWIRNVISSKL